MTDNDFNNELTAGTYVLYSGGRNKKRARILSKINSISADGNTTNFVIQTEDSPQAVMYCKESDITPWEVYPLPVFCFSIFGERKKEIPASAALRRNGDTT